MKNTNAVGWFDLYVKDMNRAAEFYETILNQKLTPMEDPTNETEMMSFASDMNAYGAGGALVKSKHGKPGPGGTAVYFSVKDCSIQESLIEKSGGKVIRPKFSIGEFGWVTLCQDTEGNLIGFNSME